MREALSLPSDNLLRFILFNGLPKLRRAIAPYLRRTRGMDVSPDCIIIRRGQRVSVRPPAANARAHHHVRHGKPWLSQVRRYLQGVRQPLAAGPHR